MNQHGLVGGMEIAFHTKALRDICASEERMRQEFGPDVAKTLKGRLADLKAAVTIKDVVLGKPRLAAGASDSLMQISLGAGYFIIVKANHSKNPVLPDGRVDWSSVSRLKVMRIGKCDD
jgi:hypothetical protein